MQNLFPLLKQSCRILYSFLSVVVVFLLLDGPALGFIFKQASVVSFLFVSAMSTLVRVCALSGFYGVLSELASGEEYLFSLSRFRSNIRQFWFPVLCITLLPSLIHLWLFAVRLPTNPILLSAHIDIGILYLFARVFLNKKYLRPARLPSRSVKILGRDIFVVLALYALYVGLTYGFVFGPESLKGIISLASKYVQLVTFIFLVLGQLSSYPEIKTSFSQRKELFLVCPAGGDPIQNCFSLFNRVTPAVFGILPALTPTDYRIRKFFRVLWQNRYFQSGKLVAITCHSFVSAEAYRIARGFKQAGAKVVMGGPHVTFCPDEALEFCDSVVVGEAEGVWEEICRDYEAGTLKKKYLGYWTEEAGQKVHQAMVNYPSQDIQDCLEVTRGCKFDCSFCSVPGLTSGEVRSKSISQFIALLDKFKGKKFPLAFIDSNIYRDSAFAKQLFRALKPLKITWDSQCSLDIGKDPEALTLLKESGCSMLLFGYEITPGSPEAQQRGKLGMAAQYQDLTRKIKCAGIGVKASFIFGFDSNRWKDLGRYWAFSWSIFPSWSSLSMLTPFPGTKIFYDLLNQDRIVNLNWRNYSTTALVFRPGQLSYALLGWLFPVISVLFALTASVGGIGLLFNVSAILGVIFFWK